MYYWTCVGNALEMHWKWALGTRAPSWGPSWPRPLGHGPQLGPILASHYRILWEINKVGCIFVYVKTKKMRIWKFSVRVKNSIHIINFTYEKNSQLFFSPIQFRIAYLHFPRTVRIGIHKRYFVILQIQFDFQCFP